MHTRDMAVCGDPYVVSVVGSGPLVLVQEMLNRISRCCTAAALPPPGTWGANAAAAENAARPCWRSKTQSGASRSKTHFSGDSGVCKSKDQRRNVKAAPTGSFGAALWGAEGCSGTSSGAMQRWHQGTRGLSNKTRLCHWFVEGELVREDCFFV